jgi:DNA-binding NarL/FixJ family response regulator
MRKMKVLVVDNHDLILHSLTQMLKEENIASEILTAGNVTEGVEKAVELKPNLIISDYKMGNGNGLDLFYELRAEGIYSKFLIISMIDEGALINMLYNEGVDGYINKESSKSEIINGITQIIQGNKYLCELSRKSLKNFKATHSDNKFLSKRELEILKLVVQERKNQDIAELLNITVSTVETHKKNLIKKLGVKSSIGLVKYSLDNKIFE